MTVGTPTDRIGSTSSHGPINSGNGHTRPFLWRSLVPIDDTYCCTNRRVAGGGPWPALGTDRSTARGPGSSRSTRSAHRPELADGPCAVAGEGQNGWYRHLLRRRLHQIG